MAGPHHHTQGSSPQGGRSYCSHSNSYPSHFINQGGHQANNSPCPNSTDQVSYLDGDPLSWDSFYKLFESIMADTSGLSDHQRTTMLLEAMLDSHAWTIAETATVDGTYESTLRALTNTYGRSQVIFLLHLGNIATSITKPIACTCDSMLEVKALLSKTYRGLQACKLCTAEHIL